MNAKESDAAAAFTTNTANAFVEWLLRKATDDDQYTELGTAFHGYAAAHDQRAQWERERPACCRGPQSRSLRNQACGGSFYS